MSNDIILILDDDSAMRSSLEMLLGAKGYTAHSFATAEALFQWEHTDIPTRLILDQHLATKAGINGPS